MPCTIGIDLDNTLINYDQAFYGSALAAAWIDKDIAMSKTDVRDAVRRLHEGEAKWQALQAKVYGPDIGLAQPMPGALDFLRHMAQRNLSCCVISHKTRFAAAQTDSCDLHEAALSWLEQQGFFKTDHSGLSRNHVFFCETRAQKLAQIRAMECRYFIDDLLEVFAEPEFPAAVEKICLTQAVNVLLPGVKTFSDWRNIREYVATRAG